MTVFLAGGVFAQALDSNTRLDDALRFDIDADHEPLGNVLEDLQAQHPVVIELAHPRSWQAWPVTAHLQGVSLDAALRRLLTGLSYLLHRTEHGHLQLLIVGPATPPAQDGARLPISSSETAHGGNPFTQSSEEGQQPGSAAEGDPFLSGVETDTDEFPIEDPSLSGEEPDDSALIDEDPVTSGEIP